MDKAPAYGAGDSGFESQYGLTFFSQKMIDLRGNRTPNLRVWNPTRCHCAMKSILIVTNVARGLLFV